jgi:hypothetical protein
MAHAASAGDPLPDSKLAVLHGAREVTWWRSSRAPAEWTAALPQVVSAVRWRDTTSVISWGELSLRGTGEARRTGVVLARFDPRRITLRIDLPPADASPLGWLAGARWSIADAPGDALIALNAGQFTSGGVFGWLVREGREVQPPNLAPLAPAVVVDIAGAVHIVPAVRIDSMRRGGGISLAFQSYPALLDAGRIPRALQRGALGVDVTHRDARLALCTLPDGRVLVALTRFEGLGGVLQLLPFGLTTPEMAALMGALGCRDAVLLDGGVSGQLLLRDGAGAEHRWPGMRDVPVGLIGVAR